MIPDPRPRVVRDAPAGADELYRVADASLAADTGERSFRHDATLAGALRTALRRDDDWLGATLAAAPSLDIRRHLWRLAADCSSEPPGEADVGVRLFAIPVVIVTGVQDASARVTIAATLSDPIRFAACMVEHGALGGNRSFALSNVLCGADAIDIASVPALLRGATGETLTPVELAPAPLEAGPGESAHLRFIVGSALASRDAGLFSARDTGRWGRPFAKALMDELATPAVSLVALPRPPRSLLAAVMQGRAAQREIGAQLFASRALRELRAAFGEPVAVVSAHVAPDAPGGGELRLSLSSPLSPRDAQGFRCPLYDTERVEDVLATLVELLRDCRVVDVRVLDGVHADRDPVTGGRLLFKPDTAPPPGGAVH